ncbi:hypothetical protein [Nocardia sp. NPDC127526]|uniref:hypothetical protein n=1 Tax=Nocardia sp. NPDC127526 TaxID=3345393 RepID=UPI003633C3D8
MPSFIDLLLHPALAVDFVHQLAVQFVADTGFGSSFPPSGSGTGSGIGNCVPTGSVTFSGGMECGTGSGVTYP